MSLIVQYGATKYLSLGHLGFKDETTRAMKKRQIPEAMEEIKERRASTEQIWLEKIDSGRHNARARGEGQGAAVLGVNRVGGE